MSVAALVKRPKLPQFAAKPAYAGGKARLVRWIFAHLPKPKDAPVFLDPFLGAGSVSTFAKLMGFAVRCNDTSLWSAALGRALIVNDTTKLSGADISALLRGDDHDGYVEREHGGRTLPAKHARFLDGALAVARKDQSILSSLRLLLCLRVVLALRPMGNFGAKTIVDQLDRGDYDEVNQNFLTDRLVGAVESSPSMLMRVLIEKINSGVFGNGQVHEAHQRDAFEFLADVRGDIVYLDPPYGGTQSYSASLNDLASILAGHDVKPEPSRFSGREALDVLDELIAACSHIPTLALSYGNKIAPPEQLQRLVARHRRDVTVHTTAYTHQPGLASDESKRRNLEVLVVAGGAK